MTTMKIAIPSMGETLESFLSNNLGHAPFIIIYDDETKDYVSCSNIGFRTQDGSGLKAVEIILQNKADILLTLEIGRKAYSGLLKEHINVQILNSGSTVRSAINNFLKKIGT
ncbi:MAG: hypothetical protein EHM47_08050 [Ignavibacteriales bacterium]|nr:MAG: hypothetical protein EHM47_08050 [Ignavibacteriales bacterium]